MKFLAFFLVIFTVVYASETGAFELEEHEVRVFFETRSRTRKFRHTFSLIAIFSLET